jgi:hypothetical protein
VTPISRTSDRGPSEGSVAVSWLPMPRCGLRAQLGDDRQDGAGYRTGAARADLCDQASCGPHVRAWCAHSRYAKSGGRFHPCRPGVEPRRWDVGRDDKHWGSFNEAFSKVATRRAISARSRIPRKNFFHGLALSRAEGQSRRQFSPKPRPFYTLGEQLVFLCATRSGRTAADSE